jgi:hypothetical protein
MNDGAHSATGPGRAPGTGSVVCGGDPASQLPGGQLSGLGYRYLDDVDGQLYERASGRPVGLADVGDMLRLGARIRVIRQPAGVDCTVEVLVELLAPILSRTDGMRGLFNVTVVTGEDGAEPGTVAGGTRWHTGRRRHSSA